jgi:hypothetical protein
MRQLGGMMLLAGACALGCQSPFLQRPPQRPDPYSPGRYPLPTPPKLTEDPQSLQPPQVSYSPVQPPQQPAGPANPPPPGAPPLTARPPGAAPPFVPAAQQATFQPGPAYNPQAAQQPPQEKQFEDGQVVAIVGSQYVLGGDVTQLVNLTVQPFLEKAKSSQEREAIEAQKPMLARQMTKQLVDTKLLHQEFLRKVPPDKLKEVQARMRDSFEKALTEQRKKLDEIVDEEDMQDFLRQDPTLGRLCLLMRENKIESFRELDFLLRRYGSSLPKQQRFFAEYQLGRSVVMQQIKKDPEITHEMLLNHYQEHAAEYDIPAKARYEVLTVHIPKFRSEQEAAWALGALGNQVIGGANFQEVAKRSSQGYDAESGGLHDWTTKGSLASEVLDQAIFSLPLRQLSLILKDDNHLHIVRVLERQEAGRVPFEEAQDKLRKQIKRELQEADYRATIDELKAKTSVWTIYDDIDAKRAPTP